MYGCWEPNLSPLQEQHVLFNAESFLQAHYMYLISDNKGDNVLCHGCIKQVSETNAWNLFNVT